MTKRYVIVSYVLLQGLSIIGMDKSSDMSGSESRRSVDLRRSNDTLSNSQELKKTAANIVVRNEYYHSYSPCGNWLSDKYGISYSMKPVPPLEYDWCP